ncbi:MAG: FKBP-type peptidyl-prolyl cis-trans isomerase [Pseudomonadales bacterium]|nr:FKBP-type peptidyl-prolyl cis-trans isomerase [Pseudomonadales bacterium]MDG1443258.1 FKBP-type peptidyl-prolyl cis-trans isomerase [Pseudomonadales bacterium]
MSKISININAIAFIIVVFSSISFAAEPEQEPDNKGALEADLGYFFGYSFGNMLKEGGNDSINIEKLVEGMQHALEGVEPALTQTQQEAVIAEVRARQTMIKDRQAEAAIAIGREFLAANALQDEVVVTASGLQHLVLEEGTGAAPLKENRVVVHYQGSLIDGSIFDSSIQRGEPVEFGLAQVIPGWTEGLQLMKVGGKSRFFIPSDLAYGPAGTGGIPPHSVLIFDVELIEIK